MPPRISSLLDGLPIVASTADRNIRFATPDTNQRVHNLQTGAIERWTGSAWVTDFSRGTGADPNVSTLYEGRVSFGTANTGINDGDNVGSPIGGVSRNATGTASTTTNIVFQAPAGANATAKLAVFDNRRTIQPFSTNAVDGLWLWRPWQNAQNPISFSPTFHPTIGTIAGRADPSVSIEGWVRKFAGGDGSDCHFFMGFTYFRVLSPSRCIVRVGLLGDGAGGYRFGSVNAPDGVSNTTNLATDIDANWIQPTGMAAPGTNWMHVRLKMMPPTPTTLGCWACFLNDNLVKVFDQVANFPRGYFSGAPINDGYRAIECGFGSYTNGVGVAACPVLEGLVVKVEDDWAEATPA